MTLPSWRDWLFSIKTFAAAMLALFIALAMDLPRPYWAMTTVYVVASPLAGAAMSKALYRTLGTLLGASGAIVLVPAFVDLPELLSLAVAAWAATLLYLALLDRTPRAYAFMLAAYTLPLIALPTVSAPQTIFDVALARSEEIILGILCASVVCATIFPQSVARALFGRVSGYLRDAGACAVEALRGEALTGGASRSQKLAADVAALDALILQLSHESKARDLVRGARELRGRLLHLLPLLSSLSDRMRALAPTRQGSSESADDPLFRLADETAAWISEPLTRAPPSPKHLYEQLAALSPGVEDLHDWTALLRAHAYSRLQELIDLWQDCLCLHQQMQSEDPGRTFHPVLNHRPIVGNARHHDHGLIAVSSLSAALATLSASFAWIQSGWANGANFVAMTTVACCFFGALDRPAPLIRAMITWFAVAQILAGVWLFTIVPLVQDFETLVLVLAPPFLLVGAFIPRPELALATLLLAAGGAGSLAIQSRYGADFTIYLNESLAVVAGLTFAWIWVLVTKPFGVEIAARRLLRSGWSDLAATAAGARRQDHGVLTSRTLDRLGQLVPRLAAGALSGPIAADGLRDLRVGYNVLDLQRDRRALPGQVKQPINAVLTGVARHYAVQADSGTPTPPDPALREKIDQAIADVLAEAVGVPANNAVHALVGLRQALFPDASAPVFPPRPSAQHPALIAAA